jgi:hypothetical protein
MVRATTKRKRATNCFFPNLEVGDFYGHVEANLENQLGLLLEPRRDDHVLRSGIEVYEHRRPFEESQCNVLFGWEQGGHERLGNTSMTQGHARGHTTVLRETGASVLDQEGIMGRLNQAAPIHAPFGTKTRID